jgi:hypothetical protein
LPSQAGGGILDAPVLTAALQDMASGLNAINPGLPSLSDTISPPNSAVITGLSSTERLSLGMPVSGSGIPAGTTIAAILSGTSIQLSNAATGSSVSLNFPTFIFNAAGISGSSTPLNAIITMGVDLKVGATFILTSQALTAANPLSGLLVQNAFATFTFSVGAGGGVDVGIGSLDLVLSLSVSFTITLTDNNPSDTQYDNTTTIPFADLLDHVGIDISNPTGTLTLSINAYDPLGDQVGQLTLGSVAFTL